MERFYAGEHVEIRKGVAINMFLHPVYSKQQNLVERFRREARAASRIGHPNIIDVTDFGTTEDGCAYFVMDGIDLADVLSHERRIDRCARCASACRFAARCTRRMWWARTLPPRPQAREHCRDGEADFVKVLELPAASTAGAGSPTQAWRWARRSTWRPSRRWRRAAAMEQRRRSDIYSVGALLYGRRSRACRRTRASRSTYLVEGRARRRAGGLRAEQLRDCGDPARAEVNSEESMKTTAREPGRDGATEYRAGVCAVAVTGERGQRAARDADGAAPAAGPTPTSNASSTISSPTAIPRAPSGEQDAVKGGAAAIAVQNATFGSCLYHRWRCRRLIQVSNAYR